MPIDEAMLKDVLARWTSGITVVTTVKDGQLKGTTASSFTSVSLHPPLVLICLGQQLYTHQLIEEAGVFAVNILSKDQLEWGKLFAGMYPEIDDRFAGIYHHTAATGSPILTGTMGWLDCRIVNAYPAGDHTIFVGEVLAADIQNGETPLVYHNRTWGRFAPVE
jgi:flavin reductase (DIM6/NTAB) family NADH-FMN oxidoreductase RutF